MPSETDDSRDELRRRTLVRSLRGAYTDALLAGDPASAEIAVRDAIDAGLTQAAIDDEVVAPAMRRVGELWEAGAISVADEHLATEISLRVLALQREVFRVARRRARHTVLLAAVQGERHVVGLRMAGNLLTAAGYDVRCLGADVPVDALAAIVARLTPAVVGLTVTMAEFAPMLPATIARVQRTEPAAAMVLGGSGVPEVVRESAAVARCRSVVEAVETVDALVHRAATN
jgi:methanogenic corrinoid protein MtbC1